MTTLNFPYPLWALFDKEGGLTTVDPREDVVRYFHKVFTEWFPALTPYEVRPVLLIVLPDNTGGSLALAA